MAAKRRAYQETTVSAHKSKAEIRDLLVRYGADQFGIMEEHGRAVLGFVAHDRLIRLEVPLPDYRGDAMTPSGKLLRAGTPAANSVHDQEERRIWRATRAWIFAQLEAVESGIKTFEELFLSDTILPNGQTFSQWAEPQIDTLARGGKLPQLPGLGAPLPARS